MPILSSIEDPALRDWVTNEVITAPKLEADYRAINTGMKRTLQYLVDNERNFPGSAAPTDIANGMIWYDNANSIHKGRVNSRWESIKSGVLHMDVTRVFTSSTGVLITYNVPANTFDVDGKILRVTCWGTRPALSGTTTFQPRIGGTVLQSYELTSAFTDWRIQFMIVRTGSSAQNWVSFLIHNQDASTLTTHINNGSVTEDETTAITLDINVSVNSSGLIVDQLGMIVELLG